MECQSEVASSRGSGALPLSSLLGVPHASCFAFACLLTCEKGHLLASFSSHFSLSTLPLVSIGSGKYSTYNYRP